MGEDGLKEKLLDKENLKRMHNIYMPNFSPPPPQ